MDFPYLNSNSYDIKSMKSDLNVSAKVTFISNDQGNYSFLLKFQLCIFKRHSPAHAHHELKILPSFISTLNGKKNNTSL